MRSSRPRFAAVVHWTAIVLAAVGFSLPLSADETAPRGQQLYASRCADCHGETGQGGDDCESPLEGELSVAQLADLIQRTMPQDDPGSLTAEDSAAVAAWVHQGFYSPMARERNRPARIELARLTVRQTRQALADLVGSFRPSPRPGDASGLEAEYFRGRRLGGRDALAAKRIDAVVDFNFAAEAPVPEISEPHEFSIRWQGSLLATETGEHEFVVRTEHAVRLWVNDMETPLIDAWVKSGEDTEYNSTLFLVAGRHYPLRLEFTKAKQGVDDSDKQKKKPESAPASISLRWKRPRGVVEPIPARHLRAGSVAEVFVCATPFPPDDRSYGWERGTSVSSAWEQATTDAAIDTALYVASHANELAGTKDDDPQREQQLRSFCRLFAERAFRRPLDDETARRFVDRQFDAAGEDKEALRRVVLLVLKSPRFLFREVGSERSPFDVAARLSFGLWDSLPDQELWRAATESGLDSPEALARQAERMLDDPRARLKLREFLLTWLGADADKDLRKDAQRFPGFDAATIADTRTSLERFLDEVLWSDDADYRQLLLADEVLLNRRLAEFYGAGDAPEAEFVPLRLDDGKRAGVLTHPYVMASFAHASESSPIHRGVFVARGLLGVFLRPPPEAVAPLAPDLHPGMTTRERVELQTGAVTCATCHGMINPLGFSLEHYDAAGRYRETERGKPIDAKGAYRQRDGELTSFENARELAEFLAVSEDAHAAFVEQLFHHLVQQPVRAYGPDALERLRQSFAESGFHIRQLAVEVMAASALVP